MAIGSHLEDFFGKPVKLFEDGSPFDIPATAPRIFCDVYGETDATWEKSLAAYLAREGSSKTTHLVSGMATEAYEEPHVNAVLKALIARKADLPNLEALFIGDITFDECELSWLNEGDLRPAWEHFPDLKAFAVRGYPGEMGQISLPKAESFVIECSGLTKKNAQQIQAANLPNVTHLELWIGTESYGGETDVSDWEPLLSGKLFPKLKYLGLKNCDFADELAQAVAKAPN